MVHLYTATLPALRHEKSDLIPIEERGDLPNPKPQRHTQRNLLPQINLHPPQHRSRIKRQPKVKQRGAHSRRDTSRNQNDGVPAPGFDPDRPQRARGIALRVHEGNAQHDQHGIHARQGPDGCDMSAGRAEEVLDKNHDREFGNCIGQDARDEPDGCKEEGALGLQDRKGCDVTA